MREIRTRFAPSPTGYMHIGNLRTAIYEYLVAKSQNGKFILRIEDTDQERYVEGAIEVIYNTMHSVGLHYDEGPDVGGDYGPYTQSERKGIYKEYAHKLVEHGGAYFCFCSKDRLDNLRKECEARKEAFRYDGHCQQLSQEELNQKLNNNEPYVVRQKVPQGGTTSFTDLVYGTITVENSQLDEGVLLKADGMPTYNFANVIDDHLMQITHVVRGSEYLSSTPKYNLVYQAFGWEIPDYIHLPPIMKTAEKKLSKREGDASFEDFVNKGFLKEAIVNYIVLLGWNPGTNEEFFTLDELKQVFNLQGLSKSPAIFDPNKLRWMNGEYIRRMQLKDFHALALPYYEELDGTTVDLLKLSKLLQQRTEVLGEIPEKIDFLADFPEYDVAMYVNKKMKTNLPDSLENLKKVREVLAEVDTWEFETMHDSLFALVNTMGVKNGQILWPLRCAVSGKDVTPGGGVELAELMGKEESLRRIDIGIAKLSEAIQ
jgi:glutamyl-tRNA synthetase